MHRIGTFLLILTLMACAAVKSPNGGPKDTKAPEVKSIHPANKSVSFDSKQVQIHFNEFIAKEDFKEKVIVSPPFDDDFKILYKGKKLKVVLPDSLLDETTYSIQFGNTIKDYTEGNELSNFQYVFSTGKELDSLWVEGVVLNAETGVEFPKIWVLLYPEHAIGDSAIFKESARYLTQTDENGYFKLENLAFGSYNIFALEDINDDLRYEAFKEKIAFSDTLIIPGKTGFQKLKVFEERNTKRKFLGGRYSQYGRVDIKFQGNTESLDAVLDYPEIHYETWAFSPDSMALWFNPKDVDSLSLQVYSEMRKDTVKLNTLPFKKRNFKLNTFNTGYTVKDSIFLSANMPFELSNPQAMYLTDDSGDSVALDLIPRQYKGYLLDFDAKENQHYHLHIPKASCSSIFGDKNDSLQLDLHITSKEEYAVLMVIVPEEYRNSSAFFQLVNNKGKVVVEKELIPGDSQLRFDYLPPIDYTLRLVLDENKNGIWDTGSVLGLIQPEVVLVHDGIIRIKANWQVEIDYKPKSWKSSPSSRKGNLERKKLK